jgi:hypothetical protein
MKAFAGSFLHDNILRRLDTCSLHGPFFLGFERAYLEVREDPILQRLKPRINIRRKLRVLVVQTEPINRGPAVDSE